LSGSEVIALLLGKFVGVRGRGKLFLVKSVGIDETNTFLFSIKTVIVAVVRGLRALKWSLHNCVTNLRCVRR